MEKPTAHSLSEIPHFCTNSHARVLVLSRRNIESHVSRVFHYEFEDVIRTIDTVDILAPVASRRGSNNAWPRRVLHKLRTSANLYITHGRIKPDFDAMPVDKEYDLFFYICRSPRDLVRLQALPHWRTRCHKAVCWLDEVWMKSLERFRPYLDILQEFDHVFTACFYSVPVIAQALQKPCHFMASGVDTLRFCPYPLVPHRPIDVYYIGRRSTTIHRALLEAAKRDNLFYIYDTVADFSIYDYTEHRALYANMLKRSRYFLVHKAKFDALHETGGQEEIGARFFEGAAGGAVLLGNAPETEAYRTNFDWQDAVLPVPDDAKITELLADLNAQPERLARIRADNIAHSLLRHDWVYRWETVLTSVDLPPTPAMRLRQADLKQLAAMAFAQSEPFPTSHKAQ